MTWPLFQTWPAWICPQSATGCIGLCPWFAINYWPRKHVLLLTMCDAHCLFSLLSTWCASLHPDVYIYCSEVCLPICSFIHHDVTLVVDWMSKKKQLSISIAITKHRIGFHLRGGSKPGYMEKPLTSSMTTGCVEETMSALSWSVAHGLLILEKC